MTVRIVRLVLLTVLSITFHHCLAQTARELIQLAELDLRQGNVGILDERSRRQLSDNGLKERIEALGTIQEIVGPSDQLVGQTWEASGRAVHLAGISDWRLVYSANTGKIVYAEVIVTPAGQEIPALPDEGGRGGNDWKAVKAAALSPCTRYPELCKSETTKDPNPRQVEFLFATTRAPQPGLRRTAFSGERGEITLGAARVRIPETHSLGHIELPRKLTFLGYDLYEQKVDPNHHFVIKEVRKLQRDDWEALLQARGSDEALVFVHGYNNSFEDSLYNMAQLIWDLQYRGNAVLFSWASRGYTLDYVYDQQSALIATQEFTNLLSTLHRKGIKRIHILAHSMGNFLILEALKVQANGPTPVRISELIMAAPDVDRDYFKQNIPAIQQLASGVTLYASSADRAMQVSRRLAGNIPRAGDVPKDGPVVLDGMDTIDVTAVGAEIFGINHDVFASERQIMNDIGLLLQPGSRRAPNERLSEIRGVPEGVRVPKYWRYGK